MAYLSIHLSVPLIYFLRVQTGSPLWAIPILIAVAVAGQVLGGRLILLPAVEGTSRKAKDS